MPRASAAPSPMTRRVTQGAKEGFYLGTSLPRTPATFPNGPGEKVGLKIGREQPATGKPNDAVNGGVGRNLVNELPARSDGLPRVYVSRSASPCSARSGQSYLSFFSRLPSLSHSPFSPPNSAAPFPLNLSPSIVRLSSTVIVLSMSFRSAENVSFRSLNFAALIS